METKTCSRCGIEWTLAGFHNDRSKRDGKCSQCKLCRRVGRADESGWDALVVRAIAELSRWNRQVFPLAVQMWIGVGVCERKLRGDMARLAKRGDIIRLGERKGYLSVVAGQKRQVIP